MNIIVSRPKLLLLLATLAAFGLSIAASFHFDDYSVLSGNVWRTLATRPLTALTFWFSRAAGDRNPVDYHLIDLALHIAAVLLLYDVLRRLISERAALIAALIFAIHPIQAEAVDYVFARATELDTVLCLAALSAWTRGRHWYAVAWFGAALAAKEECVSFPIFLWILDRWILNKQTKTMAIAAMLALSLIAGVAVYVTVLNAPNIPAGPHAGVTTTNYFLAQGPVILRYLRLLIVPWGFNVDPQISIPPLWIGALAWTAIMALAALPWKRWWFVAGLILLLPSSSIFAVEDLAADRRMYLPMIAFAALIGLLLEKAKPPIIAGIALILIGLSVQRTLVWRTEQTLWSDAVSKSPDKVRPKVQLARVSDSKTALTLLEEAKTEAPNDPKIASEEGRVYLSNGEAPKALVEFGRALALDPSSAEAMNNRGAALLALGQRNAAQQDFERALKVDPCQPDARANLARLGIIPPTANCE